MNKRQAKKQYKKIHGHNPPKTAVTKYTPEEMEAMKVYNLTPEDIERIANNLRSAAAEMFKALQRVAESMARVFEDMGKKYSRPTAVARYTLAVNRRFKRDNEPTADFIPCVAFGKAAEFAEKWFRQGMQVAISGRIQTGSYTNREGRKVYTTEVVLEEQEFAESKRDGNAPVPQPADAGDGFMNIPDGIEDNIPFN